MFAQQRAIKKHSDDRYNSLITLCRSTLERSPGSVHSLLH